MLTVAEASARILADIRPLPAERCPLLDSVGQVLAAPAVARYTLPHWDNSAMDGYAVRSADLAGGVPATLTEIGAAFAGKEFAGGVGAGGVGAGGGRRGCVGRYRGDGL